MDEIETDALVVGAGPAGLMAAEVIACAGLRVLLADARPSFGRKLLMAGKSGLNLTMDAPLDAFLAEYREADWLMPVLRAFGPEAVMDWARGLGVEVFTGSSARVFPREMKASPLLRAWLARLAGLGVESRVRWRWLGDGRFATPAGEVRVKAKATVLALGGASWVRLGSDGKWSGILTGKGVAIAPFRAANMGFDVDWSPQMARFAGQPVKTVVASLGGRVQRGEFVVTATGVEGGLIYALGPKAGDVVMLDLMPDWSEDRVAAALARPRGKASMANHLRKSLGLSGVRAALLHELKGEVKALPLRLGAERPLDEAISTAGGVTAAALDEGLMLTALPGVFCAGEMLDWDAPTGGYLLTGCLATGRWAGLRAVAWVKR
jgi:uncharacterized flavoprotein (TIGR03862 family)